VANERRRCERCQAERSVDEFHVDARRKGGRHPYCKACRGELAKARYATGDPEARVIYAHDYYMANREATLERQRAWAAAQDPDALAESARARRLRHQYGLSVDEYDAMLARQGGVCAVCGGGPGARAFCVDHDHDTGAVRGLLCNPCNAGIGQLGDDPARLRAAADYLERTLADAQ
jgi:hypothetical protein